MAHLKRLPIPADKEELIDWLYEYKYITNRTIYNKLKHNPDLLINNPYYADAITQTRIHNLVVNNWPDQDKDYSKEYFTIESLEDNNRIGWKASRDSQAKVISISTDKGNTWTDFNNGDWFNRKLCGIKHAYGGSSGHN